MDKSNKSNLFGRIEGYAQENFTTEILAWILNNDDGAKTAFLKLLLSRLPPNRRPKLRKAFRSCLIETQPSFDFGRPDMTITPTSDPSAKVLVEVKTQSPEGDGQIKKYLRHGHVAYLTPGEHDGPDLDGANTKKYLRQLFWHEVYSAIEKHGSHNILHKQFLKYLEARRMGPLKPISEDDLRASLHAADAIRKFQALVDAVRKEIKRDWEDEFGKNVGLEKATLGVETGELPYWWFRAPGWKKRERRLFICIGLYVEKGAQDGLRFYVELGTSQKKFGRKLEMNGELKRLCDGIKWNWYVHTIPNEWGYYKTFPVRKDRIERIAQRQIKNVRSEEKNIRKLVKFVEKML